jgi:hypothetical protein
METPAEKDTPVAPATQNVDATSESSIEGSEPSKTPNFIQIMLSVGAAAIGVQTGKNYERDFTTGSPLPYIVGGIIFTVLFVLTIIGVVSLVLP